MKYRNFKTNQSVKTIMTFIYLFFEILILFKFLSFKCNLNLDTLKCVLVPHCGRMIYICYFFIIVMYLLNYILKCFFYGFKKIKCLIDIVY